MSSKLSAFVVILLLAAPGGAFAQTVASDRGFISINGGYRVNSNDFQDSATFPANAEEGRFDTDYAVRSGPVFDVSGGVLVKPTFGLGAGLSRYSRSTPIALIGSVPHPFFFDRSRAVSGEVVGLKREELAVHVQARGVFPVGDRLQVTLFGGPSYFRITQGLVTGFVYGDAYPYDEVSFRSADTANAARSTLGFNAGGDFAVFFTPRVGVGLSAQYAGATVALPSANGGTTDVKAGGVSTGAGLRLRF